MRFLSQSLIALAIAFGLGAPALARDFLNPDAPSTVLSRRDARVGGADISTFGLEEYARMLRAVELTATFETKRDKKHQLGPVELSAGAKIDAKVGFERKNGKLTLNSLDLKPTGTMSFGGRQVTRVTFNNKGEMHLELKGLPDLTITNIEKKRNGETEIHVKGWPNITIKKDGQVKFLFFDLGEVGADFEMPEWPPNLENILKMVQGGPASDTGIASVVSQVSWKARVLADSNTPLTLGSSATVPPGRYELALEGQARELNGALATVGNNNKARLTMTLGGGAGAVSTADAKKMTGTAVLDGAYRLNLPLENDPNKRMHVEFDGRAEFNVKADEVAVSLPSNTRISAANAEVNGGVDLRFQFADGKPAIGLSNGNYSASLNGPMTVENLKLNGFEASELGLNGRIEVNGSMETRGDRLAHSGSISATTVVDTNGFVAALRDEDRYATVTVLPGSSANINIERFTTFTPAHPDANNPVYLSGTNANGNLALDLRVGEAHYRDEAMSLDLPAGPHRLTVASDLSVLQDDDELKVHRGWVRVGAELGADGSYELRQPKIIRDVATVTAEELNVRKDADKDSEKVGSVLKDSRLTVLGTKRAPNGDTWLEVEGTGKDGNPIRGFVSGKFVDRQRETAPGMTIAGVVESGSRLEFDLDGLGSEADVLRNMAEVIRSAKAGVRTNIKLGATSLNMGALRASFAGGELNAAGNSETGITGSATVRDAGLSGEGLDATVRGEARVGINSQPADANGARSIRMTFELALQPGSRLLMNRDGSETDITIDGTGSVLSFEANASLDANGRPVLHALEKVEARLELGSAAVRAFGTVYDAPGIKTLSLTEGRIVVLERGLDIFGALSVTVRSDGTTPALRIRW